MLQEPAILEKVEEKLQREFAGSLSIMRSKPFFLEFMEEGISKGTSLNPLIQTAWHQPGGSYCDWRQQQ